MASTKKNNMTNKFSTFFLIAFLFTASEANCQWTIICNTGNGFVDNFDTLNGELYATGFFNTICGAANNYVAKYNGGIWQAVGNGFPNAGHHLTTISNQLYGVAYQPAIDSNWLYKFDGTTFNKFGEGVYLTTAVVGFSQTANLYNIIDYNGSIVVSGEFDRVGSKHISGIMKWNGTQWDSLGSGLLGNIPSTAPVMYPHDMCLFGTDLIVAGNFRKAGGQIVNGIAKWDGTQWLPMGQGFNSTVYGVEVYNGELYAGGDFTMSGTTSLTYIAKWNGTNWVDPGFRMFYISGSNYSFIHTLSVLNNKLVISGGFDRAVFGTDTMHCQAVVSYDGTMLDTLGGGLPNEEVEALAIYNGQLFAGGGPTNTSSYIASYNLSTAVQEINQPTVSINIFPNPTNSTFNITSEQNIDEIKITNLLGHTIYQVKPNQKNASLHIDTDGIYFVTITSDKQTVTQKLTVTR